MNSSHRFLEGLFVGGIFGFLFGLLYAPKSGAELRRELAENSDDLYKQASSQLTDLKDRTDQALTDFHAKSDAVIRQASAQVQETRDQLSSKLQDLSGSPRVSMHDNTDQFN